MFDKHDSFELVLVSIDRGAITQFLLIFDDLCKIRPVSMPNCHTQPWIASAMSNTPSGVSPNPVGAIITIAPAGGTTGSSQRFSPKS